MFCPDIIIKDMTFTDGTENMTDIENSDECDKTQSN